MALATSPLFTPVMLLLPLIAAVLTSARPQEVDIPHNRYKLKFSTMDGTSREETSILKNAGTADEEWVVVGKFSWTDPDGRVHLTRYAADKNGYNAIEVPFRPKIGPLTSPALSVKSALAG